MRNDIRRAFEENTEDPHPSLRSALRARLDRGRPANRRFGALVPLAAAAAAVLVVLVSGYLLLSRGQGPQPVPGGVTTPSPQSSATPAASPVASPVASPTAPGSPEPLLVPFTCGAAETGPTGSGSANVTDVRVGASAGYDRFVIQFDGPAPEWSVTPQSSSSFVEDGSGRTVTLAGSSGLRIVIHGASAISTGGRVTYSGPADFTPNYAVLREARRMGDFERTYTWGLGLSRPNCFRTFVLTGNRLVVDVQTP